MYVCSRATVCVQRSRFADLYVPCTRSCAQEEALSHYQASITIDPSDVSTHVALGIAYLDEKEVEAAQTHATQALKHSSGYGNGEGGGGGGSNAATAHDLQGLVWKVKGGHTNQAVSSFQRSIEIDPTKVQVWKSIGEVLIYDNVQTEASLKKAEHALNEAVRHQRALANRDAQHRDAQPDGEVQHYLGKLFGTVSVSLSVHLSVYTICPYACLLFCLYGCLSVYCLSACLSDEVIL